MTKVKIERTMKLKQEDMARRGNYDLISGCKGDDQVWIKSFGNQAKQSNLLQKPKVPTLDEMKSQWSQTLTTKETPSNRIF